MLKSRVHSLALFFAFFLFPLGGCDGSETHIADDASLDATSVPPDAQVDDSALRDAGHDAASRDAAADAPQSDDASEPVWGAACSPMPGVDEVDENGFESYLDFTVVASDLGDFEGKTVRLRTDQQEGDQVYAATEHTISDGGFTVTWLNAKERYTYQSFFGYVDVDDDGVCSPNEDLVWNIATNALNNPNNDPFEQEVTATYPSSITTEDAKNLACAELNGC